MRRILRSPDVSDIKLGSRSAMFRGNCDQNARDLWANSEVKALGWNIGNKVHGTSTTTKLQRLLKLSNKWPCAFCRYQTMHLHALSVLVSWQTFRTWRKIHDNARGDQFKKGMKKSSAMLLAHLVFGKSFASNSVGFGAFRSQSYFVPTFVETHPVKPCKQRRFWLQCPVLGSCCQLQMVMHI
jgi:hypothetical protein